MFLTLRFAFFIIRIYLCSVFRRKHPHRSASQYSLFYLPLHEFCALFPFLTIYKLGFVSLDSTFLFFFSRTAKSPAFTSKLYPFSLFCICLNLDSYAHIILFLPKKSLNAKDDTQFHPNTSTKLPDLSLFLLHQQLE